MSDRVSQPDRREAGADRPLTRIPAAYAVGIVNYRTYGALERCLGALSSQTIAPRAIVVVDADGDPDAARSLQLRFPGVVWKPRPNEGYASGANAILRELARIAPATEYVLVLNADVEPESGFAEELLAVVGADPSIAIASGKLLRPPGHLIDSAGILVRRSRRLRDRGSEEPDRGQYDAIESVFAVSGAAMLLRREALASLALDGEVFDEDFFLYHEDTDLAWRANRLGWRVMYVPSARALHARGWRRGERFRIPSTIRQSSFRNRYLELIKNESLPGFIRNLPFLVVWEFVRLGYALLWDRATVRAYRDAWRLAPRAWRKRRRLASRKHLEPVHPSEPTESVPDAPPAASARVERGAHRSNLASSASANPKLS